MFSFYSGLSNQIKTISMLCHVSSLKMVWKKVPDRINITNFISEWVLLYWGKSDLWRSKLAQFKIWTAFNLILALLHQTPISKHFCKDHMPKHFLHLVRRCATAHDWRFSDFSVMKMTLCSEFFNFELQQIQNQWTKCQKISVFNVTLCPLWDKIQLLTQLYSWIFENDQKWGWMRSKF